MPSNQPSHTYPETSSLLTLFPHALQRPFLSGGWQAQVPLHIPYYLSSRSHLTSVPSGKMTQKLRAHPLVAKFGSTFPQKRCVRATWVLPGPH